MKNQWISEFIDRDRMRAEKKTMSRGENYALQKLRSADLKAKIIYETRASSVRFTMQQQQQYYIGENSFANAGIYICFLYDFREEPIVYFLSLFFFLRGCCCCCAFLRSVCTQEKSVIKYI